MSHEFAIRPGRPLRKVVQGNPEEPLPPPPPTPPPEPPPPPVNLAEEEQARQTAAEREAITKVLGALVGVTRTLEDQHRQRLAEMERATVELAVAIASRLLQHQVRSGEFPVETLVRRAVERLGSPLPVRVSLHPEDLALLQRRLGAEQGLFTDGREFRLVADDSLQRGDCRAEAGDVSVLLEWEAQLAGLCQQLLENLGHGQEDSGKAQEPGGPLGPVPDGGPAA